MSIIKTKEQREIIERTAISQGVANSRPAAMAQALLALDEILREGGLPSGSDSTHTVQLDDKVSGELSQLTERLARIEEALAKVDVVDADSLDATISDLRKRLGALEEALGGSPAETKRTGKSRKSS